MQFVCHQLRDNNLVVTHAVGEMRNASLHHVVVDEGGVEVGTHSLECHAQEVAVGLEDSFLHGKALNVSHIGNMFQDVDHGVVDDDGVLFHLLQGEEVGHLYMASEADDLVADGVFESQHHTDGDNHDGKSDGYSGSGNMYGRARNFSFVALLAV